MTGKENDKTAENQVSENDEAKGDDVKALHRLPVMIIRQYLRDLSLENPNAPESLDIQGENPALDVNFSMDARKVISEQSDRLYEVVLGVHATAKRGEKVMFLAEIEYGVLVTLGEEVPEAKIHPLLLIEMPRYVFPHVRQILADATAQAGFMPLYLQPVDFKNFYMERYGPGQKGEAA